MPSRSTLWLVTIMVLAIAVSVHADVEDPSTQLVTPMFSATLGLDVTFVPLPPLSFDIVSALSLTLSVADFVFASQTEFALSGFQSQRFTAALHLGAVTLSDWVAFEPLFSWNQFAAHAQFFAIDAGIDLILASIGSTQTPTYSMAGVLQVGASPTCGVSLLSLTGFGAVDLLALSGGIGAPLAHRFQHLFHYLDTLCADPVDTRVTVLPDFYFEEQVLRIELDLFGLLASSTTWFDWLGFSAQTIEVGFAFLEPNLAFLMAISLDGAFSIDAMEFILDVVIQPVSFTSRTAFIGPLGPPPAVIAFAGQQFALAVEAIGVLFTFETDFDSAFLFERQLVALETEIPPVRFASLTAFTAAGFDEQCVRARVQFTGVSLFSLVGFDLGGITQARFGFDLTF